MYGLISSLLGYTGSGYQNADSYILYCSTTIIVILLVIFTDLLYRLLRSFIRK